MQKPDLSMTADTIVCPSCTRETSIVARHIAEKGMRGEIHCMCGRVFRAQQKTVWSMRDICAWDVSRIPNPNNLETEQ